MADYRLLEDGLNDTVANLKRELYEQAAARVALNDPSRDVLTHDSLQNSIYITFMDYNNWPQNLGRWQKLSQIHAGDKAHVEFWFSKESPFNQIAVSSTQGEFQPAPRWMRSWYGAPFWVLNRLYNFLWKGRTLNDGTFAKVRQFTNNHYKYYRIPLTPNEMDRLYMFSYEEAGKPFNWIGSARSWKSWLYRKSNGSKWFCSELIFAGLKHAGVLDRLASSGLVDQEFVALDPGFVTPTKIYDNLCAPNKTIVYVTDNQVLGQKRAQEHFTKQQTETNTTFHVIRTSRRGKRR